LSRRWLNERKNDPYYRWAQEQGYRSRAAFKLKQLDERFHFLREGKKVLDIGAAPGGWLQVSSEIVGEYGLIVGVDLVPIESLGLPNVQTIEGDILDEETQVKIKEALGGKIDVVLSDIAQNVSGNWDLDQYKQIELAQMSLNIASRLLKKNGWFIVKVFQGSEYEAYLKRVRTLFRNVKVAKPKASRKASAEIYVVAQQKK
jgi:23S rRNA (uridine2552-2'-O)-methyltransferase